MTRYEQIAGTPERFVEIVNDMCKCVGDCYGCPFDGAPCTDDGELLDWLNEPVDE